MGTPDYMSPEQLRGGDTDARSDIFSFGLVLREMGGGKLPPRLERIARRCLAEDAAARWQTAGELRAALESVAAPARLWKWPLAVAAVAVLAIALLALAVRPARIAGPLALTGALEARAMRIKLSPDGRSLAFYSGTGHYVRPLDGKPARPLYAPGAVGTPFWSPDGRSVAIAGAGRLVRVDVAPGSLPAILAQVNTNIEGAWGPDGTILIGLVNDGIYRVSSGGGALARVTTPDPARGETRHLAPRFLPGGRRFLYIAGSDKPGDSALWAGSLDSDERTRVMPMQSNFDFVPTMPGETRGYLVYLRDRILVAQAFDSARLVALGQPYALVPMVAVSMAIGTAVSDGDFSAERRTLAFRSGDSVTVVRDWMPPSLSAGKLSELFWPPSVF